jgi:hypothetical protein
MELATRRLRHARFGHAATGAEAALDIPGKKLYDSELSEYRLARHCQ